MTIIRVQLCAEDRDRYEVGDLTFDSELLKDMQAGELEAFERESDVAVASLLPLIEPKLSKLTVARRACAFLALRQAGHTLRWDDFQPRLLRATFEPVEVARTDPPAGSSESSSEDAPPSAS